MFNKAVFP